MPELKLGLRVRTRACKLLQNPRCSVGFVVSGGRWAADAGSLSLMLWLVYLPAFIGGCALAVLVFVGYDEAVRRYGRIASGDEFDWWADTPWDGRDTRVRRGLTTLGLVLFCATVAAGTLTVLVLLLRLVFGEAST